MVDTDESRMKKNRNTIQITILLIGFLGCFICTIIWWIRIRPWFSHGEKDGKAVYQSVFTCWILAIIGTVVAAFVLISNFRIHMLKNYR